jgi:hypothetical protein
VDDFAPDMTEGTEGRCLSARDEFDKDAALVTVVTNSTLENIGVGGRVLNPSGSRCIGEDEKRYEDKVG